MTAKTGEPLGRTTQRMEIRYNDARIPTQMLEFDVATSAGSLHVKRNKAAYTRWKKIQEGFFWT